MSALVGVEAVKDMKLLDDVIASAVGDGQSISILLRKCLLLAHDLENTPLEAWATQELNGYSLDSALPEYRVVHANAFGNFAGAWNSGRQNWPIPPLALEENHRAFAETVHLHQAVSAYEHVLTRREEGRIVFQWPPNLVIYYQHRFFDHRYALISAWQEIDKSTIVELLDTIRTRTLNMALGIKKGFGSGEIDLKRINPFVAEEIRQTIVNNIYGGTNFLASGNSPVNANVTETQTTISVGNIEELKEVLRKCGLNAEDFDRLGEAIRVDGNQKPGSSVMGWVKAKAPQVVVGGVKVGASIAQQLLIAWIKQYYGLP